MWFWVRREVLLAPVPKLYWTGNGAAVGLGVLAQQCLLGGIEGLSPGS